MTSASTPPSSRTRLIVAASVGNYIEWFDFSIYGLLAATFSPLYFPAGDTTASLLEAFAVFALAYALRPIGGIVFGSLGDRIGRRPTLAVAILTMSVATLGIGLLPTHDRIGLAAPVLLTVLRCVQGLSVGGEWAGASSFIVEHAPAGRRGLHGSAVVASAALGSITGSLIALALSTFLSPEDMTAWGWRVPFIVAAPMGLVGLYMRRRLDETPAFQQVQQARHVTQAPVRTALRSNRKAIGLVVTWVMANGVGYYFLVAYLPNYLRETGGLTGTQALLATTAGLAVLCVLAIVSGAVTDRIGRKPAFLFSCAGYVVLGIPIFMLVGGGSLGPAMLGMGLFAAVVAPMNVNASVALVEIFPTRTRFSGAALGHNIGSSLFSGTAPMVGTALVAWSGNRLAPAYYLMALAALAGVILAVAYQETYRLPLVRESDRSAPPEPSGARAPQKEAT